MKIKNQMWKMEAAVDQEKETETVEEIQEEIKEDLKEHETTDEVQEQQEQATQEQILQTITEVKKLELNSLQEILQALKQTTLEVKGLAGTLKDGLQEIAVMKAELAAAIQAQQRQEESEEESEEITETIAETIPEAPPMKKKLTWW